MPHDEGTLAQTAWRILLGEVPHRDFDAVYTGLLGYLHAGAMAVGGESLLTMRVVLLLAALLWVPAVWTVAWRLAGPRAASAATLLAVVLGPAVYPVGMPSWYNAFLATWGLVALLRWDEGGGARWLAAAGACAGLSVLMKATGLYFLAAALFFVLHREALRAKGPGAGARGPGWDAAVPVLGTILLVALLGMEALLVRSQAGARTWFHYLVPTAAVAALASAALWGRPRPGWSAARRALRGWLWIAAGFALPVAVFAAAFAAVGGLDDLARGVAVLPRRRLATAASPPLPLLLTAGALLPVALLAVEGRLAGRARGWLAGAVAAAGAALLLVMDAEAVYDPVWYSLQPLVPLATLAACAALLRGGGGARAGGAPAAVLWAAALTSLVQYPFAGPIYFAYAAPFGVLAALVALSAPGRAEARSEGRGQNLFRALARRPVAVALAGFYLVFAALGPDRGGLLGPPSDEPLARLDLARGGLRIPVSEAAEYEALVEVVRERSGGDATYATPDVPQVYFLTGLRNPTRTLFEVFDDPRDRAPRVLRAVEAAGVDAVVLNTELQFSPPDLAVVSELERRYPRAALVGPFIVRWRDGGGPAVP